MAELTYTPNIGLGTQLDKTEHMSWDAITENWNLIDAYIGYLLKQNSSGISIAAAVTPVITADGDIIAVAEKEDDA